MSGTFEEPDYATWIEATYQPQRTDDLIPEAAAVVGQRLKFICVGRVDWDNPYYGQPQWLAHDTPKYMGWVPSCDLQEVELVS